MMQFWRWFADATWNGGTGKIDGYDGPKADATPLLESILNVVWWVLGIVSVIMIIVSGIKYLTSNGDPQKAASAMRTILYSVIGLVVAISAFAITNFVIGKF
jgi:hypothetical protein